MNVPSRFFQACMMLALVAANDDLPSEANIGTELSIKQTERSQIKQSEAHTAVSYLNNEIIKLVVEQIKRVPDEIELRPPERLLSSDVGSYDVPITIKMGNKTIEQEYGIDVIDVDECEDASLPKEWRHECVGDFTACKNLIGSYDCVCIDGTIGNTPCAGVVSSIECTHTCRDNAHHLGYADAHHLGYADAHHCEQEFSCTPINECADESENDCSVEAVCHEIPCDDSFAGLAKNPPSCRGSFTCACRDGFEGSGHGDGGCSNVDECASPDTNNCHKFAICTDETPSAENDWQAKFSCACRDGFSGDGVSACVPEELCKIVSEANACHPEATCAPCADGTDANCRASPRPSVSQGHFKCECDEHFKGDGFADGSGCAPIDYCTDSDHTHDCNEHATCQNLGGGKYTCECVDGFKTVDGGRGPRGCEDVDECADYRMHDCHFGAVCTNEVPSEENGYTKYTCACNEKLGWSDNTDPSVRAGYGSHGCVDDGPPKAFLRCSNDARLDLTGPMEEVIDHAAKNKLIANCVPDYDTNTAQGTEGHQVCTCPDDADVYRQYDTYTEVGMVVNDDNVEGTHELREKIILDGIKQSFEDMDSVMHVPGEFEHGVRYELEIPKGATRPASKQTWFRKIVVEPVNECVDTTIPETYQQKCHKYARCVDTPLSYTCECREGFQCDDCDGFRHGFGVNPGGPGCKDETPPTIVLGGPWPAYSETCACGDDGEEVIAEMPSEDFLTQNGLTYTGTDHDVDENFNIVVVPFDGVQRHAPKRVTCDDIPLTNPEGTKKNPVRCDEDSVVWKIEYTATDSSGNKATPQSHIVIQRKTQVLQRLLELEAFVEKMEAEQSGLFESMSGEISHIVESGTFLGMNLQKAGLAFLLLLATAAFYYSWIPKVIKMFVALTAPNTMQRRDFEEGMDLWLRMSTLGFSGELDRNRSIERKWASMEDSS